MDTKQLQKQIMRRVYYSYAISIGTHAMLWQGVFLGGAAVLLARWLHVASIFDNLLATPVGTVPAYVANAVVGAVTHGEFMTVVMLVGVVLVGLISLQQMAKSLHVGRLFTHLA